MNEKVKEKENEKEKEKEKKKEKKKAVSYTHLDVYKRQIHYCINNNSISAVFIQIR